MIEKKVGLPQIGGSPTHFWIVRSASFAFRIGGFTFIEPVDLCSGFEALFLLTVDPPFNGHVAQLSNLLLDLQVIVG